MGTTMVRKFLLSLVGFLLPALGATLAPAEEWP